MEKAKRNFVSKEEANEAVDMANYILRILKGKGTEITRQDENGFTISMSERTRQFFIWGGHAFKAIISSDNCTGLEFIVKGLKFKGYVRIWYEAGPDLFKVEFLKMKTYRLVKEVNEVYFDELHNLCHKFIERDDDPEL